MYDDILAYFPDFSDEKWLYQNRAEYVDDIVGALNDDMLYSAKRGYIAITWEYRNEWTSIPCYYFAAYGTAAEKRMLEMWDKRKTAAEKWMEEEEKAYRERYGGEIA